MNKLQVKMLEDRLQAILDLFGQIGPEFEAVWADSEGRAWKIHIKLEDDQPIEYKP